MVPAEMFNQFLLGFIAGSLALATFYLGQILGQLRQSYTVQWQTQADVIEIHDQLCRMEALDLVGRYLEHEGTRYRVTQVYYDEYSNAIHVDLSNGFNRLEKIDRDDCKLCI